MFYVGSTFSNSGQDEVSTWAATPFFGSMILIIINAGLGYEDVVVVTT